VVHAAGSGSCLMVRFGTYYMVVVNCVQPAEYPKCSRTRVC